MLSVGPSNTTIRNLADTIIHRMFNQIRNGRVTKYDESYILKLLDAVARRGDADIPDNLKGPWGQMIASQISQRHCMHTIGVRGHKLIRQNKEAIIGSALVLDQNRNVVNKAWIREILPHKNWHAAQDAINKIIWLRQNFDIGTSDNLCRDTKFTRNSLVYTLQQKQTNY